SARGSELSASTSPTSAPRGAGSGIAIPTSAPYGISSAGTAPRSFAPNPPPPPPPRARFFRGKGAVPPPPTRAREAHPPAAMLACRLRETIGGSYEIVLANTGTEAVELAARHADEALAARRDEVRRQVELVAGRWGCEEGEESREWSPDAVAVLRDHGIEP